MNSNAPVEQQGARGHANLDVLRAFAVSTVLVAHVASLAGRPVLLGWDLRWVGVFGVYVFFVHTCLVLMWSLERRPDTLGFYIRRIFRIYPLLIAVVFLIAAARLHYFYNPTPLTKVRVLANMLLVQNIIVRQDMMGTLWSLPLEVDMYLLLPMLFAFARRQTTFWALLLLWASGCLFNLSTYGPITGNVLYMVIPHFLPGVMAYIGYRVRKAVLPPWALAVSVWLVLVFFMRHPNVHRGWAACAYLGLLLPLFRDTTSRIVHRVSHRMATYSYGIYLLHFLWIWFFLLGPWHYGNRWLRAALALVATGISAAAAYHLLEEPMIRLGNRLALYVEHRRQTGLSSKDLNLEVAP